MTVRVYMTQAGTEPAASEVELVSQLLAERGRVVLASASFAERDVCRRAFARAGAGLGIDFQTPASWIEGLWELLGDGNCLIKGVDRKLLMASVVAQTAGPDGEGLLPLRSNSGTVDMLGAMARDFLPYALTGHAGQSLSPAEERSVAVLFMYAKRIHASGLCEASEATYRLARDFAAGVPACARTVVVRDVPHLDEPMLELLGAIAGSAQGRVVFLMGREREALAGQLAERFGVAIERLEYITDRTPTIAAVEIAGPAVRDAACAQMLAHALSVVNGPVDGTTASAAMTTPDPMGDFRRVGRRLAAKGVVSRVRIKRAFEDSRAGQSFFALIDLLDRMEREEPSAWWPAPELVDWLRSPFSGVGAGRKQTIVAFDTALRRNRRLAAKDVLAQLNSIQSRELNREHEAAETDGRQPRPVVPMDVVEALRSGAYARALRLMHGAAEGMPASAFGMGGTEEKRSELEGIATAHSVLERARELGVFEAYALDAVRTVAVRTSLRLEPADVSVTAPVVTFTTVDELARHRSASFGAVLLADMDTASYPAKDRDTVESILAQKLGCSGLEAGAGELALGNFDRALFAAASKAHMAYVVRTREGEECFAAPAFTELARRAEASGSLVAAPTLPGEGPLTANIDPAGAIGLAVSEVRSLPVHGLTDEVKPYVLLPSRSVGGEARPRKLSASSIENYLSCPFRWFMSNRVPVRRFDTGFTPVEMGNFVHDVMQRFHERLIDEGLARVTPDNLDACMGQMETAFAETREEHARGRYLYGRRAQNKDARKISAPLVALDQLERYGIDAILAKLREVVRYESTMLSAFTPELFEYAFDNDDITYAGHPLGGRIDRIDTAPSAGSGKRFVVIDYKNRSVNSGARYFDAADPTLDLPEGEAVPEGWLPGAQKDMSPHVQTLIYASAYQELTDGSAQGAVYFGTRKAGVSGAVSSALTECEPPAFPQDKVSAFPGTGGTKKKPKQGSMEFSDLLKTVEKSIARELSRCAAGCIDPSPYKDSCGFCPVTMCEKRRS